MQNNSAEKRKVTMLTVALVCMVVIIVILIMLLITSCPSGGDQISTILDRDPNASVGQLEGKTPEEIQAELDRIVEEGMFNISINPSPVFENGDSAGNLRIENVPSNHYLMSVQITLEETGEIIYTSGVIEPNHHIESDNLDVPLEKGSYTAIATFTAYDPETEEIAGKAAARITIIVKN